MVDCVNSDFWLQELHTSVAHFWEDFIDNKGKNALTDILPTVCHKVNVF